MHLYYKQQVSDVSFRSPQIRYFICLEFLLPLVPLSPSLGDMTLSDPTSLDLAGAEVVFSIGGAKILESCPIVNRLVDLDRSGVHLTVSVEVDSKVLRRWLGFGRNDGKSSSGMTANATNLELTSLSFSMNDLGTVGEHGVGSLNEEAVLDREREENSATGLEEIATDGASSKRVRDVASGSS